uniref:Uncharacterized protein n=1 Tax=Oryza glumipatula TaxID=40148 RepID=A0A0E0BQG5_9ORYZ
MELKTTSVPSPNPPSGGGPWTREKGRREGLVAATKARQVRGERVGGLSRVTDGRLAPAFAACHRKRMRFAGGDLISPELSNHFGQKGLQNSVKPTKQNKFTNVVQINGGTFPESLFLDALKVTVSPRYGPFNAVETEIEVFHIKREKRIRSEAQAGGEVQVDLVRKAPDASWQLARNVGVREIKINQFGETLESGDHRELGHAKVVAGEVEVNLNNAGSTLPACNWWPPRSSEVTRPSAPPQPTPSQRQQSVPATHDWKAVE